MTEKAPFIPAVITFKGGRLAFAKIHKAEPRKPRPGQDVKPDAPKFYSAEVLLDPTNIEHQKTIAAIKQDSVAALNHRFGTPEQPTPFSVAILDQVASGERVPPGFHLAWGYGNALPAFGKKIYDGYKDMFWVRVKRSDKDGAPELLTGEVEVNADGSPKLDSQGRRIPIQAKEGGSRCPFGGCVIAGTLNVWSYNNESRGVNANMRQLVYQGEGKAFGGGRIDSGGDFAALGDLGNPVSSGDGPAGGAAFDPFAIT